MKQNTIITILSIMMLGSFVSAIAQQQDERLTREMTLEREYDPTVQDANKVSRLPEVKEPEITRRTIEYSPFTIPANPDKEIFLLPSGDVMTDIPFNPRKGYFNFAGGMYTNLSGDFGYHFLNDERDKLNFYLSHRSTNGKVGEKDNKQKAVYNDNLGGIDFRHNFDPAVVRLGANYTYSFFNYYGMPFGVYVIQPWYSSYMASSVMFDNMTNQVNQTINAYAGIQSREYTQIGYLLDFDFVRFTQKYGLSTEFEGLRENKYTLRLGISPRFGDGNKQAGLEGKIDIFNYDYPLVNGIKNLWGYRDHTEVTITPYYRIEGDNWKTQLGINLMYITGDSAKFFLSPNITIEAEIARKTVFYVNAGGEIQSNDAYGLSKRNRYMDYSMQTLPSRTWLDAKLGIRNGVVPGLWFDLFAGYKITANEPFFVPLTNSGWWQYQILSSSTSSIISNGFNSYYTAYQPNASLFRAGASLKYIYKEAVDFSVKGVYNYWSLSAGDGMESGIIDNVKPYGRPAIEVNADLTVRPVQPLALTLGYYLGADRYTFLPGKILFMDDQEFIINSQEIKMKDINDLNFTSSWNFNKTFSAYLKLNNLLFQQQELWYGYPLQGFNAMVGINLNF